MNKLPGKNTQLRSAYIRRIYASRPDASLVWGVVAATWVHMAGTVVLMNVEASSLVVSDRAYHDESLLLVQRMLQTGATPFDTPGGSTATATHQSVADSLTASSRGTAVQPNERPQEAVISRSDRMKIREELQPELEPPSVKDKDVERLLFARVDEAIAAETAAPNTKRIAKFNARADEERRTPLTSEKQGELSFAYRDLVAQRDDGESGVETPARQSETAMGSLQNLEAGERRVRAGTLGN